MKILMISYRIPYPLTAGYRIRIFNEAKYLKNMGHEVDLVFTGKKEELALYEKQLQEVFSHIKCFEINKAEVLRNLFTHTLRKGKPFQVSLYWNREMNSYIQSVEKDYDAIIGNAVRNAEYIAHLPSQKAILDMHDAISYNYLNLIQNIRGLKRAFYKLERKLLLRYECEITRRIRKLIIISEFDKEYLRKSGADISNITVIPLAVRDDITNHKHFVEEDECSVCFLGKMSYQPNSDAVLWFAQNVFPPLKRNHPDLKFYVLGIEPPREIQALQGNGIEVTGFCENPYEVIERCMAMVVPIRNGAGTQNKILESMVVSTPCVISPIAAEGLNGDSGKTYLVADTASEYIAAIESLIQDPNKRRRIGEEASKFVERYSWATIKGKYVDILKTCVE